MANKPVSDFFLPATGGKTFRLSESKAELLVLYFYPKDHTPGCTAEGLNFRDLHPEFRRAGCDIAGISRDSIKSHDNFKAKMSFPFDLLSDEDEKVCNLFGVIKMKNIRQTGSRHRAQHVQSDAKRRAGVARRQGPGSCPGGTDC